MNAAIYGYGVAGAQLGAAARKLALQDWTQHEIARDRLEAMLTALGVKPVAAQPAYQLPFPVHGTRAAISLAGYLENQVAAAYLGIVALDDPRLRAWGAGQAQACALRATTWLGRTAAFPGLTSGSAASARPFGLAVIPQCQSAQSARSASPPGLVRAGRPVLIRPGLVRPGLALGQLSCGADRTCATRSAARSSSVAAAIRSAQDHQNHQLPSSQQPA